MAVLTQEQQLLKVQEALRLLSEGKNFQQVSAVTGIKSQGLTLWKKNGYLKEQGGFGVVGRTGKYLVCVKDESEHPILAILAFEDALKGKKSEKILAPSGPLLAPDVKMQIMQEMSNCSLIEFIDRLGLHLKSDVFKVVQENRRLNNRIKDLEGQLAKVKECDMEAFKALQKENQRLAGIVNQIRHIKL